MNVDTFEGLVGARSHHSYEARWVIFVIPKKTVDSKCFWGGIKHGSCARPTTRFLRIAINTSHQFSKISACSIKSYFVAMSRISANENDETSFIPSFLSFLLAPLPSLIHGFLPSFPSFLPFCLSYLLLFLPCFLPSLLPRFLSLC